jgi:hypothetical protein
MGYNSVYNLGELQRHVLSVVPIYWAFLQRKMSLQSLQWHNRSQPPSRQGYENTYFCIR